MHKVTLNLGVCHTSDSTHIPQQDTNNIHMGVNRVKMGMVKKTGASMAISPLLMWTFGQYMKFIPP